MAYSSWGATNSSNSYPITSGFIYGSHTHTITPSWDTMRMLPDTPKEKPMSTLEKVKQQRREERERGAIEKMYRAYDKSSLANAYPGQIISFEWSPEGDDRVYRYAAICNDDKWWLTGRMSPSGVDYEDFVAWLIDHKIHLHDITFLARP